LAGVTYGSGGRSDVPPGLIGADPRIRLRTGPQGDIDFGPCLLVFPGCPRPPRAASGDWPGSAAGRSRAGGATICPLWRISARTKAALAAAKARGQRLAGFPARPCLYGGRQKGRQHGQSGRREGERAAAVLPLIRELQAAGTIISGHTGSEPARSADAAWNWRVAGVAGAAGARAGRSGGPSTNPAPIAASGNLADNILARLPIDLVSSPKQCLS
jgi:hypothetical protein